MVQDALRDLSLVTAPGLIQLKVYNMPSSVEEHLHSASAGLGSLLSYHPIGKSMRRPRVASEAHLILESLVTRLVRSL